MITVREHETTKIKSEVKMITEKMKISLILILFHIDFGRMYFCTIEHFV